MARKPRLDMPGFHHVINRGVEKREVFIDDEDYTYFLELICTGCEAFDINLHSYCLMNNHYHLLIETKKDNLSKFMRSINAKYASYFNRKNKRVGHLWQGRFKSWYVSNEAYLYILIKYIESNPLKAKIVKDLKDYKYASYNSFIEKADSLKCAKESIMFLDFASLKDREEFFESDYDEDDLKEIAKNSNLVIASLDKKKLPVKALEKLFKNFETKIQRNEKVKEASKLGYSQSQIATVLRLSQPAIANILKK
ncbi:MAG: transposase [Campylobacterota bacterium]|nr:transposase [Campylobacterota bacterium]